MMNSLRLLVSICIVLVGNLCSSDTFAEPIPRTVEQWLSDEDKLHKNLNDRELRNSIEGYVHGNIASGRLDILNERARRYVEEGRRTPSGLWYITSLHDGIRAANSWTFTDKKKFLAMTDLFQAWIDAYPKSSSAHVAYAQIQKDYGTAWQRTLSYADAPDNAVDNAVIYYGKALAHLEENWDIARRDPQAYALRIRLLWLLGRDWKEGLDLLIEMHAETPDYFHAYFNATNLYLSSARSDGAVLLENLIEILLSRLPGRKYLKSVLPLTSPDDLINWQLDMLARSFVNEERPGGLQHYARIYWSASERYGPTVFASRFVNTTLMKRSMDEIAELFPDAWNLNNLAYFSCVAGDRNQTADFMAKISIPPIMSVWKRKDVFKSCLKWATEEKS